MKPDLKVVRLDTGYAKGQTVREAIIKAGRKAKDLDAQSICVVMRTPDNSIQTLYAGCDWVERTGMLEIAKVSELC